MDRTVLVISFIFIFFMEFPHSSDQTSAYQTIACGNFGTKEYSLYFRNNDKILSPFHDVPLYADKEKKIFNMIVEIPRNSCDKLEINKLSPLNPLKHDIKDGKIRRVKSGYPHNYGALPQTWEKPSHKDKYTGYFGDNDPIDVVEIGSVIKETGSVITVKILGIFGLVDSNETDWKIIAVDTEDKLASQLNDLCDVQRLLPGVLEETKNWFITYKQPAVTNTIALQGEIKDKKFALTIIDEVHEFWKELITSSSAVPDISRENTCVDNSPFKKPMETALNNITEMCKQTLKTALQCNKKT